MAARPPRLTRVPEVYSALFDLVAAEPEIDTAVLVDGGRTINDYVGYVVMFGYRPNSDEWVRVTRESPRGMAGNDIETISIGVLVAVTDRDDNMANARALAAEKMRAVERVATTNLTLGLSGVTARITDQAWMPLHTDKGAECNVTFDVEITAAL